MNAIAVSRELMRVARSLKGGTWALPGSPAEAKVLLDVIQQMDKGQIKDDKAPTSILYNLLGDDQLYDEIDRLTSSHLKSVSAVIKRRIKQLAKQGADDFKDKRDYDALLWLAARLK